MSCLFFDLFFWDVMGYFGGGIWGCFEGEVKEKELASSLRKYKNIDNFRRTLKSKVEEKKELQLAIFEAIEQGNNRFFFKNIDSNIQIQTVTVLPY